jgi:hypothetical protein
MQTKLATSKSANKAKYQFHVIFLLLPHSKYCTIKLNKIWLRLTTKKHKLLIAVIFQENCFIFRTSVKNSEILEHVLI